MKFDPLINLKLLTIANSFLLNITEHEIFSANKYENANMAFSYLLAEKFHAQLSWAWKKFYNPGAWFDWVRNHMGLTKRKCIFEHAQILQIQIHPTHMQFDPDICSPSS